MHAVDGVDLEVYPGETLGLVGETGCGKSTLARVVMRLFEATEGTIEFEGRDITQLKGGDLRDLRRDMQMIFQDPYRVAEPAQDGGLDHRGARTGCTRRRPEDKVKGEVQQLMELVGLNPEHYNRYPHEFSGGQRQRIGVARALALRPKLIVCDEPVSALDVSIQAQILNLLDDLQDEFNLTYLFIAHDLSVVKHVSDRVAVMYLGKIVEMADGQTLYRNPEAPVHGRPALGRAHRRPRARGGEAADHPGGRRALSPIDPPSGCRFHPRCPNAQFPKCKDEEPELLAAPPRPGGGVSFPARGPYHRRHRGRCRAGTLTSHAQDRHRRHRRHRGAVPDPHDPAALGQGERPVRHVRRHLVACRAAPRWSGRLDQLTVVTGVIFGLCTFWLSWQWG